MYGDYGRTWEEVSLACIKNIVYLLLLLFNWTANGVLPGENGTTIRQHNTQSYTDSKEHITRKEYDAKNVKLSL
jgi:hypothetical protein